MEDEILHCVQNDKEGAWSSQFNSIPLHLLEILHCGQDDRVGIVSGSNVGTARLFVF
ncbi:MAG TPA: hypothetical protein VF826_12400 [Chloroflexia bacterium]|jgi:hypothetical protein